MNARAVAALAAVLCLAAAAPAAAAPFPYAQTNVSAVPGRQAEVAIAADPTDPRILLAGSNSAFIRGASVRVSALEYGSIDGGATWTRSEVAPPQNGNCDYGDPAPGIGPEGRQYLATLVARCDLSAETEQSGVALVVSTRADATSPWQTVVVSRPGPYFNDKPALAVDSSATSVHRGRVYVAWSLAGGDVRVFGIVLAHSDDGGLTWSASQHVTPSVRRNPEEFASMAVDPAGTVYVAWANAVRGIFVARSTDGGTTFTAPVHVATAAGRATLGCAGLGSRISAQPDRCITPAPLVTYAGDRVVLTYSSGKLQQDVYADALDPLLTRRLSHARVNRPDGARRSDQFLPTTSYDAVSHQLWTCFYDTRADRRRVRARFACAWSADAGVTWAAHFPVASVASDEVHRPANSDFGFGDYEGVVAAGGAVHPIWTDARLLASRGEEIYTTTVPEPVLP